MRQTCRNEKNSGRGLAVYYKMSSTMVGWLKKFQFRLPKTVENTYVYRGG